MGDWLARCGVRARCVKEKANTTGPWLKDVLLSRFSHRGSKHLSKAREGSILSGSQLEGTKVHHGWDSVWLQAGHTAGTPCPLMSCQGRKLGQTVNLRVCSQRDTFSKRVYSDQASATSCSDVQNCMCFPSFPSSYRPRPAASVTLHHIYLCTTEADLSLPIKVKILSYTVIYLYMYFPSLPIAPCAPLTPGPRLALNHSHHTS